MPNLNFERIDRFALFLKFYMGVEYRRYPRYFLWHGNSECLPSHIQGTQQSWGPESVASFCLQPSGLFNALLFRLRLTVAAILDSLESLNRFVPS